MTFIEIYNRIITHWGDKIDFSDGVIFEPKHKTPGNTPTGDKSFQSGSFFRQWGEIEETVGHDDTYGDLMVWTMYQVFHRHARQLFRKDIFTLNPKDIGKAEIEKQYYDNLHEESWEEELITYVRTIE
ncbi:MAG: hypothetical protein K8R85_14785 [Bacteroidetes bacterium]|nr:hypothetical protein [Bacteroidota bacterium]